MKKRFEPLEIDIIVLDGQDVICTSPPQVDVDDDETPIDPF